MNSKSKSAIVLRKISNVFSGVFSPLLVPTYAYAIALWISYISILPEKVRLNSCILVLALTALMPMGMILFLMRKGKVTDAAISDRKERFLPFTLTIICYLVTAIILWHHIPQWLNMFFFGAVAAAIIDLLINIKWKISAHMTSMGGLCALIIYIGAQHINTVMIMPWIASGILASGCVGSARLFLGRHTPAQVYAGWCVGLTVEYVALSIFPIY